MGVNDSWRCTSRWAGAPATHRLNSAASLLPCGCLIQLLLCVSQVKSLKVPNLRLVDLPGIVGSRLPGEPENMPALTEVRASERLGTTSSPFV